MTDIATLGDRALSHAVPRPFWTDRPGLHTPSPPLDQDLDTDLVVIGGGFTGLWAAWRALERDPDRDVTVLEARTVGYGASGRNGGFVSASLTHGLAHGLALWPREIHDLQRAGRENLAGLVDDIRAAGIDCDLEPSGKTTIAVQPWQVDALRAAHRTASEHGEALEWFDAERMRADVDSPTYLGGLRDRAGTVMIDPARLAWGMAAHLRSRGVRIVEGAEVERIESPGAGVRLTVRSGRDERSVSGRQAVVATAAYPSPLRRLRAYLMPLYDHVLVTEPLSADELASLGWRERQGLTDAGNQFHYYRLTADDRILWGGWDANYHRGGRVDARLEQAGGSHALLARHFFATFPQLEGLAFTHRWAGPIDSTARFTAAYGTAHRGRVAYAVGHTGLGVGASRFSADVALDLLAGTPTDRTRYGIVRRKPFPIPPEPLRNPIVQFTRDRTVAADENEGRRGLWLRLLDRFGVGFNS